MMALRVTEFELIENNDMNTVFICPRHSKKITNGSNKKSQKHLKEAAQSFKDYINIYTARRE